MKTKTTDIYLYNNHWCIEWDDDEVYCIHMYASNVPARNEDGLPTFSSNLVGLVSDEVEEELLEAAKEIYYGD